MDENNASRSAAIIAAHRAMESSKPVSERICYDPYAEKFLAPNDTVIGPSEMPKEKALAAFRQFIPGFHEYFLARTRFIDDYLSECINNGLQQLVILGAGYDSRAYRFDSLQSGIPVFEVDHPATQAVKKDKLKTIFNTLPAHVTFVAHDFQKESLATLLYESGYHSQMMTLFIWEGVTMYLTPKTVDKVFRFVAGNVGPGSSIVFDTTTSEVVQGKDERPEAKTWLKKTVDFGEPLKFGLSLPVLQEYLEERQFTRVFTATHDYFNHMYFNHSDVDRASTPLLSVTHAACLE